MEISPDTAVFATIGPLKVNATILFTWMVMAVLTLGSWIVTRRLSSGESMTRWQNLLEVVVGGTQKQLRDTIADDPSRYIPFLGSIFLFIFTSNVLVVVPGFQAPTASLSTTTALALCVFVAVPFWGVRSSGVMGYLRNYVEPTPFMLPFNVIGEVSRTIALAVRLFGNVMSGSMIGAIFLSLAPFFFPVIMQALGLVTGVIQAYIFAVLAAVFIGAATRAHATRPPFDGSAPAFAGGPRDTDADVSKPQEGAPHG